MKGNDMNEYSFILLPQHRDATKIFKVIFPGSPRTGYCLGFAVRNRREQDRIEADSGGQDKAAMRPR